MRCPTAVWIPAWSRLQHQVRPRAVTPVALRKHLSSTLLQMVDAIRGVNSDSARRSWELGWMLPSLDTESIPGVSLRGEIGTYVDRLHNFTQNKILL
ncbi:hypothetical protein ABVT39_010666 [Epinephelus coioides]